MLSRSRRLVIFTCLMATVAWAVAACGSSSTTTTKSGPVSVTLVPSPKGPWTQNFNPYSAGADYGAQGIVYETLLFFNQEDGSIHPWLAKSYTWNSDGTQVTFNLQQGVKWTDGQAFSSADVLFTLNMLKTNKALDTGALWQSISSVSAPDANTVVVNFTKPSGPILWYLAGQTWIVSQHKWSTVSNPATFTDPTPVGTGPFKLDTFNPQIYTLKKNPNYWQKGKPQIDELRYPAYASNTSASLLLSSGQVDWTGLFQANIETTFVALDKAHNHYWFPPANVVMLYLNTGKAPWNDLQVRKALSAAIDRQDIYQTAESGYEPPASPTALVLPANKSYLSSKYANLTFPAASASTADSILEADGYTKGSDGIYAKGGKQLSFNINVVTGWTDWVTACQIMAKNFQAAGIKATVNAISFNDYISALQQGNYDTSISWTNPGPTPYYLYNSLLNSNNTAAEGQTASSNFERWNDPATDALLKQFVNTTDQATQTQAIQGIEDIMVNQLPSIPLVYGATWYEYSTKNVTGFPDASNPYAMPSPYTAPDDAVVALQLHK